MFATGYTENLDLKEEETIDENIEVHDTLNPLIWNEDKSIKEEVRQKLMDAAKKFADNIKDNEVKIKVLDVYLLGSNCNYNYTKDSDLDLHLIVDAGVYTDEDLAKKCYLAYCTMFNSKYDPTIYGIPFEIYVEDKETKNKSNGVFSLKQNK